MPMWPNTSCCILVAVFIASLHVSCAQNRIKDRRNDLQTCTFKCSNGGRPRARKGHKPVANGCGVPGFMVESKFGLTSCCNKHDICYHTCQVGKNRTKGQDICDTLFESCMKEICSGREDCQSEASMMSMGVRMFGCSAYQSSQTEACDCGKRGEEEEEAERRLAALPHDEKVRLIADYYARHNPSKTREDAAAAVDKYGYDKKAFLSLCRSLEEKYQARVADLLPPLASHRPHDVETKAEL
mmetsp:Transcript_47204/g.125440  ORF Transcript_47204/g.125440 Transcript_47204/m.125440 type:complete len:242 (-) Transcript_47204:593-1318(-)